MKKIIGGILLGGMTVIACAEAPVVDYSLGAAAEPPRSIAATPRDSSLIIPLAKTNLSAEQRINKLEQQINNINEQNLANRLEELQQNLQKINGTLESQAHQIEQLNKQLKDFYQDLNQRVGGTKVDPVLGTTNASSITGVGAGPDSTIVAATPSNVAGVFESAQQPVNGNAAFLKEQQMYQTAIDLLPDKKHESENKLREYLKHYPKGVYVANAHYWLGEINFLQKNFDAAEEEFRVVVNKYPKSKRGADAMLKLALVHHNQGRAAEAKQELQKIIKRYPGTSAAQLAKQQLATN